MNLLNINEKNFVKYFNNEDDFISYLNEVRKNSEWKTFQSSNVSFDVKDCTLYVIPCDNATPIPVRDCGITSIENRCDLYGSALDRLMIMFPNLVGEALTKAIQSKKNHMLKGYLQYGEYSAIHSDTYTPIDMSEIFKRVISHIKSLNILKDDDCIERAEWSFERVSALFKINNSKLIKSYENALEIRDIEASNIIPRVKIVVSDIAASGINMSYSIMATIKGVRYNIPLSSSDNGIYHKGSLRKKYDALQDKLNNMFSLFDEAIKDLNSLMQITIYEPINCMIGLFKSLKLPVKYSAEVVERFTAINGNKPCTAYEIYAGMSEYLVVVETLSNNNLSEFKKIQIEETLAKTIKKDFTKYDVTGTVAW